MNKQFWLRMVLLVRYMEIDTDIHYYMSFHGVYKIYPEISDQRSFLRREGREVYAVLH